MSSYKQGQEPHPSCMDGVKVKISERYKPPPKISLPMSYSQRLSLNSHIQNNIPKYDFTFERNAKECMKALRTAKLASLNQRKGKLEKIKEAREKEKEERLKKDKEQISDTNVLNKEAAYNDNECTYPSSTGVLIPMQVSSTYTNNILTPTLLTESYTRSHTCESTDKSPFNISDFEADTSSPFDNMALKTINDMAELAIVLQNEDKNINKQPYPFQPVNNTGPYTQTYTNYSGNQPQQQQQYHYPELPSTSTGVYVQPTNCVYSASNGYYYNTIPSTYDSPSYLYNNTIHDYNNSFDTTSPQKTIDNTSRVDDTVTKTVPDIMKALETELNNTYINKINQQSVSNNINSSYNHKRNKEKSNSETKNDDLDESYRNLPKNLQVLSKNISGMGFPLDRVSRVCTLLGDDQKKVVEHLLAMSDLLDLGFPETQVSSALIQCDNDRDKALDKLIL